MIVLNLSLTHLKSSILCHQCENASSKLVQNTEPKQAKPSGCIKQKNLKTFRFIFLSKIQAFLHVFFKKGDLNFRGSFDWFGNCRKNSEACRNTSFQTSRANCEHASEALGQLFESRSVQQY